MGAHSTFEQALAGVTAFATAVASESESEERRPKKAKKAKAKKERKEKKERKGAKHRSDGKRKHKKRRRSDSSSESGSDSEQEAVEVQLERGRAAVRTTRQIMAHFPAAKASLRQMFWRLDSKEAVGIGGIPDASLRGLLEVLFSNLRLLCVSEGVFARRRGGESVLQQLGPILEEEPAQPSAPPAAAAPQPAQAGTRREGATDSSPQPSEQPGAPAGPAEASPGAAPAIGPQLPDGFQPEPEPEPEAEPEAGGGEAEPAAQPRRVMGPAMPPPELLSQAAEVAAAMAAEEAAAPLIGPPPPELVRQLEAESGDARAAEVLRITRLLDAATEERPADPYELVGVGPSAEAGAIRKRYWRTSLLIHPDKCGHAQAGRAFEALAQAAKALQDAGSRGAIDKRREDAEFAAFAAAEAVREETARQWRVARGGATAEDLAGPARAGPAEREEWLTVLPAARRPSAPSQKSQTAFAQQAVAAISQDASAWTDTPAAKLLRLQQASAQMLPAAEAAQQTKAAATATAVDAYNQSRRGKSLVEQHQERQQQEKRAKKKAKSQAQPEAQPEAQQQQQQQQPWRPFDRERDLKAPPAGGGDLLKSLGELSSRFGGGKETSRGFL